MYGFVPLRRGEGLALLRGFMDASEAVCYSHLVLGAEEQYCEEDVSAQSAASRPDAWVSGEDADARGAQCAPPAPPARSAPSLARLGSRLSSRRDVRWIGISRPARDESGFLAGLS